MEDQLNRRQGAIFCIAAIAVWLALGWPVAQKFSNATMIRGTHVPPVWFLPFFALGIATVAAMLLAKPGAVRWILLSLQVSAVAVMAVLLPWAGMSEFLIIIAWQVALSTTSARSIAWALTQTGIVVAALAQALNPDFCWVIGKALAMQLLLVFTAQIMRREARTAQALVRMNGELRKAQGLVADAVRNAERLRISRELHDTWGHELTALGLQLEIASHVADPDRAKQHIGTANALSRDLLAKVRDVVGTLRETQECELRKELEVLARSVPVPRVHIEMATNVDVGQDQAHALVRCAQESITNAVRHAGAANLWLCVTCDEAGIKLVAHDDGVPSTDFVAAGSGLKGMQERLEGLGGKLEVQRQRGVGFKVEAWLPRLLPQPV